MFLCTPLSAEISVNPTVDETIKQINSIPADDIWWTVNGKDMLWNFKNLNKIFPTTTIYRKGQISPLELKPDDKISQFLVKILTRNCEILSSGFNSRGLICPFLYIVVVGKILLRFLKFQSMSLPLTVHQISSAGIELICLMVSSTVGLTEISADKGVHKNMAKTKKAKDFLNLFKRTPIYFRISG